MVLIFWFAFLCFCIAWLPKIWKTDGFFINLFFFFSSLFLSIFLFHYKGFIFLHISYKDLFFFVLVFFSFFLFSFSSLIFLIIIIKQERGVTNVLMRYIDVHYASDVFFKYKRYKS